MQDSWSARKLLQLVSDVIYGFVTEITILVKMSCRYCSSNIKLIDINSLLHTEMLCIGIDFIMTYLRKAYFPYINQGFRQDH